MKDLKRQIANEAIKSLSIHYKTTEAKVAMSISNGNTKLINELNDLCEKTLEAIYA